ncbi:MAG TPA: glycoside hydrolase family 2 TIM barrel-domain containing protein, partial [Planctomycetota bacterium]
TELARQASNGAPIDLKIGALRRWSPADPALYDLRVRILEGERVVDAVDSYFALRSIVCRPDAAGVPRFFLNGEALFQFGLLDQGFWPDGLYTAPTDAALRYDLEVTKALGFNLVRKHVKVEPERWYYHCDRLGLLVWQDIPSGGPYIGPADPDAVRAPQNAANFEREAARIVDAFGHHPCIVSWVLFNEGWGQYDTERLAAWLADFDPSRVVNATSGWSDRGVGQVHDLHAYPGPAVPRPGAPRVAVLGEFGGLGLPLSGHTWQKDENWGYRSFTSKQELNDAYLALVARLRPLISQGLAAAVYTQTTDVEIEVNGVMSYDREVLKLDDPRVVAANRLLYLPPPSVEELVATSQSVPQIWRYTLQPPADGWERRGFDDGSWRTGRGGFGTEGTPGAVVGTTWSSGEIWLRREVVIPDLPEDGTLALRIHHDERAQVYWNGALVADLDGYTSDYVFVPLTEADRAHFAAGSNTIAVRCRQTSGGQFLDLGLSVLRERR